TARLAERIGDIGTLEYAAIADDVGDDVAERGPEPHVALRFRLRGHAGLAGVGGRRRARRPRRQRDRENQQRNKHSHHRDSGADTDRSMVEVCRKHSAPSIGGPRLALRAVPGERRASRPSAFSPLGASVPSGGRCYDAHRAAPGSPQSAMTPMTSDSDALTYRAAGVDIDAGNALVERIKPHVQRTFRPEVMAGLGGFGGLFDLGTRWREPVLVSGTDGVGTKLRLAQQL